MTEWISVKDRLPDNYTLVLVYVNVLYQYPQIARFYNDEFWIDQQDYTHYINHWMELPESPK